MLEQIQQAITVSSINCAHTSKCVLCSQCWLWQYGLWSFQTGGTKLERFLPKNQHTQRKILNFENWLNGEVLKIGHHFSKESDLKNDAIKKCQ